MIKKDTIKGFVAGLIVAVLLPTAVFAASGKNITVVYGVVKEIIINQQDQTPTEESKMPFVYNGTTYVPMRYFAEAMGQPVDWDGTKGRITVGQKVEKPFKEVYLHNKPYIDYSLGTEGSYANGDHYYDYKLENYIGIVGVDATADVTSTKNEQGLYTSKYSVTFSTNGLAKRLLGTLITAPYYDAEGRGKYRIYNENNKLLFESGYISRGITEEIDVNIENSLSIKIEVEVISSSTWEEGYFYINNARILTTEY